MLDLQLLSEVFCKTKKRKLVLQMNEKLVNLPSQALQPDVRQYHSMVQKLQIFWGMVENP